MEAMPACHPPNQVAATTAGKKKMNGNSVGPIAGLSSLRLSQPAKTAAAAKEKRWSGDLSEG